jgi:hypothetical protein
MIQCPDLLTDVFHVHPMGVPPQTPVYCVSPTRAVWYAKCASTASGVTDAKQGGDSLDLLWAESLLTALGECLEGRASQHDLDDTGSVDTFWGCFFVCFYNFCLVLDWTRLLKPNNNKKKKKKKKNCGTACSCGGLRSSPSCLS